MKNKTFLIILSILVLLTIVIFRFDIVENGNGYYINDSAKKAFVIETIFNDVEPLFLFVIE